MTHSLEGSCIPHMLYRLKVSSASIFNISSLFNFVLFFKVCGISLLKQCTNLYSYPVLKIILFFLSVLFLLLLLLLVS